MRESFYDLLCAVLLGLGNMFMFMGYDSQLTIVEPVLRSVHDRKPDLISAHAGFYGAGICTVFFMFASLISPCVLHILGSKGTLFLGSFLFTIHLVSFQYIHFLPYYITSATIGIGYAMFYSGHGGYITEHSTKKTIERNSALTWAMATSCMIAGGVVLALTAQTPDAVPSIAANGTALTEVSVNSTVPVVTTRSFRQYSDAEIRMIYGAFASFGLLSNLIFLLIPTANVANSIAADRSEKKDIPFIDQMKKLFVTFIDGRALELTPLFCLLGFSTCFWVVVFPTTLIFSKALSGYIYLPALYLATLGSGEILMGIIISVASKRIKNFAQLPSLIIGAILFMAAMVLALLSTPAAATNSPTSDSSPLIEPSPAIALLIALFLGMSDNSFNTSRTVLCALAIPENIAQIYSISKFYQSLAESLVFAVASMMTMQHHFALVTFFTFISIIFYWRAAKKTRKAEKKDTQASENAP